MEKQYVVVMTITVDDEVLERMKTVADLVIESLEKALFQVDCLTVN